MNNKVKMFSVVLCALVIAGCYVGYSVAVSDLYFDINQTDFYSIISSYDTEAVWTVPASEAPEYGAYSWENDLVAVEITYELYNPFNDIIMIPGNLCYYMSEDAEWIYVYDAAGNYSEISGHENCKMLPPGESAVVKEYVLVPEGMEEIYAYANFSISGKVLIRI